MMKNSSNIRVIHKLVTLCQWLIPICCCVLTFFSVAGVSSVKRCAYIGQAVKLLSIIGNDYADPSLYSENGTIIASWKENTNTVAYMDPNYSERIYMEERRNIWILSVERKDAGRYSFRFGVQVEQLDIELTVKEELTEEQLRECPNNRPDFPKEETTHILTTLPDLNKLREGISHDTTTAWSKKDYTEGKVMSEQKLQLLYNHPQKVMMEPCGSCNSLIIGLLSAILVIMSLDIVLRNIFSETYIRTGWITGKNWIQKRLCSLDRKTESLHQPDEYTRVPIEELEMTEDQVQCWLDCHPDFIEKYHGNLLEDRIQKSLSILFGPFLVKKYLDKLTNDQNKEQIQKCLCVCLMSMEKNLDPHDNVEGHDTVSSQVIPIIPPDELGVNERFPVVESGGKENQSDGSDKDMISLLEMKNSPHGQPERNVRSDRCFTNKDPDVDSANPLLGEENLRRN